MAGAEDRIPLLAEGQGTGVQAHEEPTTTPKPKQEDPRGKTFCGTHDPMERLGDICISSCCGVAIWKLPTFIPGISKALGTLGTFAASIIPPAAGLIACAACAAGTCCLHKTCKSQIMKV